MPPGSLLRSGLYRVNVITTGAEDCGSVFHDEALEAGLQLLLHRQEGFSERRGLALLRQRRGVRGAVHVHAQQHRAR